MSPRTGRPKSDNPLVIDIKVRLDEKTYEALLDYAKKNGITKAEAIRRGIQRVLDEK